MLPMMRLLLFPLFFAGALAAQPPVPAPPQDGAILILGATAHIGNGTVIPNSAIAFEGGKLTIVADATTIRLDRSKFARIYDAAGKHVYPGFIAPDATVGLGEIGAVRATQDVNEVGALNPQQRAIVAYNTDSDIPPTIRSNGVLMAQITPGGGLLSGFSSVVQFDAWNWEDAVIRTDVGLHLNWPNRRARGFGPEPPNTEAQNDAYERDVQALRTFFSEAKAYLAKKEPVPQNLKFEAMRGIFDQKQTLFVHTHHARTIQEAVLFAESFGLRPVLVGGNDAWMVADFLRTHQVPVILSPTHRVPSREDEDVAQPFKMAAVLHQAGVPIAFSGEVSRNTDHRNLPFQAGQAVGFGLPYEAAVSALTLNTARMLGIDATAGSLETGKDATLFISEGDALDMRTCQVTAAFIQGRTIDLDNKHKQLARKFGEKYQRQ